MTQRRLPLLLWAALWPGICATHVAAQAGRWVDNPVLESRITRFEVIGRTIQESVVQLGSESLPLHLGFEAVLEKKTSNAGSAPRFTLHLANKTVREILDALCAMDSRFTWSSDPFGINIFPRATVGKASYFLNRRIDRLEFHDVRDAYQALTPLTSHFPNEQLGYSHLGGNVAFPGPWTATFKDLTVRELMNRIAAHLGPFGGWMFYGSEDTRWFNFHKAPPSPLAVSAQSGPAQPSQDILSSTMAQGPPEPLYTFSVESATPLQDAIRFATENRLPLGVVLGPSDSLCGKVKTLALKNVPAAQVFDALLSGSDYSSSVEEGVWVVRPRKVPASSGYLLHLQFDSFGGGFKTTIQGLGIVLAGYIRSRLRPGEGYIGDILSSPDAEKVDPFTLENVTVTSRSPITLFRWRAKAHGCSIRSLTTVNRWEMPDIYIFTVTRTMPAYWPTCHA